MDILRHDLYSGYLEWVFRGHAVNVNASKIWDTTRRKRISGQGHEFRTVVWVDHWGFDEFRFKSDFM